VHAALLLAVLFSTSVDAVDGGQPPIVVYRNDQLSVRLDGASPAAVLAEIGRASGAEIRGVPLEARPVTAHFDDVPLPEALHRLLTDQNFMLRYGEADQLRTIQLFGPPGASRDVDAGSPSRGRSPAAGSRTPQSLLLAMAALERHAPLPVDGPLAKALGGDTATFRQLLEAAARPGDASVRNEAFRVSLNAVEKEPDLRSTVMTALGSVDDTALGQVLRGVAGPRAEQLANDIASQAETAELRSKALEVLRQLRTIDQE
jgi:hypothetical protein